MTKVADKPKTINIVITENKPSEENSDYDYAENDEDENLSAACIASLCAG